MTIFNENTITTAKSVAAIAGAAGSIISTLYTFKNRNRLSVTTTDETDPIRQAQVDVIWGLDSAADKLAALQAMRAGDFEFDRFIRNLEK